MSVAVAQSIEAGFIPYNFAETPKVTVSFTRTVTGWYNVKFPRMKRPLFTLSPEVAQLIEIDGKFTLGCVMVDVDAIYELFVRRWIENDAEVFVHVTKFDLIAWYAVHGCELDEAEEYRQMILDVIEVKGNTR
ncbi:hypothetical protein [Aneurinibacillus aneurinilyticus]|uniref:hypothetical protein n=1 Tax=Aneurinibacillus aneurinilyticus TaxID=1391 RepID=UPI0035251C22